jgi:cytochrome c oxidase subunit 2
VVAHQWWWEFQYPGQSVTTANELHVPVGRPVDLALESADVIHSFWVPAVGGKRDVVPSHVNHLWFTPSTRGTFPGQCAEMCGVSHANMRMKLVVETPAEFARWLARQQAPPREPDSTSQAGRGRQVFLDVGCIACHTVRGVSEGVIGPDLTHLAGRTSIAGAIYPNTPEMLAKWIADPPTRKPGTLMPALGLDARQIADLVAYLRSLE